MVSSYRTYVGNNTPFEKNFRHGDYGRESLNTP